jgi:hypothetical protein
LREELQNYSQYRFLKSLPDVDDPDINIEVLLVPIVDGRPIRIKFNPKSLPAVMNLMWGIKWRYG